MCFFRFFRLGGLLAGALLAASGLEAQASVPGDRSVPAAIGELAPPLEEAEAPASLFDLTLGSKDVELDVKGSWMFRLVGGLGSTVTAAGTDPAGGFPGFEKGLVFTQIPDLAVKVWLYKRYFAEITYLGKWERNSFLLGYKGRPGEFLQGVRLGNSALTVSDRAGSGLSQGRVGVPALAVETATGKNQYDLLVRYDAEHREEKTFHGQQEVERTLLALDGFVRGRFFRWPVPLPAGTEFWLQAETGSLLYQGQHFRLLTAGEAPRTSQDEILFAEVPAGLVLVTYSGAAAVNDPILGTVITPLAADNDPRLFHELYRPQGWNPFELKNRYPVKPSAADKPAPRVRVVATGSSSEASGYLVQYLPGNNFVLVTTADGINADRPFAGAWPEVYTGLAPRPGSRWPLQLQLEQTSSPAGFNLGQGVLPGSVQVRRNGVELSGFQFEPASGGLTLDSFVFPDDEVTVSFLRDDSKVIPTDLFVFQGNQLDLGAWGQLETAHSLRWPVKTGLFTTEDDQAVGQLGAKYRWQGGDQAFGWQLTAQGRLTVPDATGLRRLAGMEPETRTVRLTSNTLRPSAAPGLLSPGPALALTEANRGRLIYRDYFSVDVFGSLVLGNLSKPGIGDAGTGFTGPYLAAGDAARSDRLAVLEYDVGSGGWAGLQVFPESGRSFAWGNGSEVKLNLRFGQASPGSRVFLQFGRLSEDFDGSGQVKTLQNSPQTGFLVNQTAGSRLFPLREAAAWTNDGDGRGVLYRDEPGAFVTREITPADLTVTTWKEIRLTLTPAEKQALLTSNSVRLVLYDPGTTPIGQLLVSGLDLGSTGFSTNSAGVMIRETAETSALSATAPSHLLAQAYPEVSQKFHADGQSQRVAELSWSSAWAVTRPLTEVDPELYRRLTLYLRLPIAENPAPVSLDLSLTDAQNRGLKASLVLNPAETWKKLVFNLDSRTWRSDSGEAGSLTLDADSLAWNQLKLATAAASGLVYLDEISLQDPAGQWAGSLQLTTTRQWPALLTWGSLNLVGATRLTTLSQAGSDGRTAWGAGLDTLLGPLNLVSHLRVDLSPQPTGLNSRWSGDYRLDLPAGPLRLQENWSSQGSRVEKINWSAGTAGSLEGSAVLAWADSHPRQTWSATAASELFFWPDFQQKYQAELVQGLSGRLDPAALNLESWAGSYPWLNPWAGFPGIDRSFKFTQNWLQKPKPWGWQWESSQNSTALTGPSPLLQNQASWKVGFPLVWGDQTQPAWTVKPELWRSLSLTRKGGDFPALEQQPDRWRQDLKPGLAWLLNWPAADFAQGLSPWPAWVQPPAEGQAETGAGLSLARRLWTNGWDLLLPLTASAEFRRLAKLEGLSTWFTNRLTGQMSAQGRNLFGTDSPTKALSFYKQDEITWTYSFQKAESPLPAEQLWLQSLRSKLALFWDKPNEVSLEANFADEQRASRKITLETNLKGQWGGYVVFPDWLPVWLVPYHFKSLFVQKISPQLRWNLSDPALPALTRLLVQYRAELPVSKDSQFSAELNVGQEWLNQAWRNGFEARIDLTLKF